MNTVSCGMRGEVVWFAEHMEGQLRENDHKGVDGWKTMSLKWLMHRLRQEINELERAIAGEKNVIEEAADVANFAMMIADNFSHSLERIQEDEP